MRTNKLAESYCKRGVEKLSLVKNNARKTFFLFQLFQIIFTTKLKGKKVSNFLSSASTLTLEHLQEVLNGHCHFETGLFKTGLR